MSKETVRELLRPYLPIWLREQIGVLSLAPGSLYSCQATILYADLSGFTRLTAAFTAVPGSAERLYDSLNRLYSALVEAIMAYEGDVVSIAGDALTAWWPDRVDLDLAQRCAAALHRAVAALPEIETPVGPFQLDLRVGVAAGPAQAALAGLPSHGVHLVLLGPALSAATAAEQATPRGTTQVVAPPLEADALVAPRPSGQPSPPAEAVVLSEEHFLPPTFVERLRLNALIAEYRRCVPVFAAFDLPAHSEDLHSLVARAQAVVLRWGGWLNEVEVGDKGSLFVLLFGAPVAHGDDATRAVGCCLELRERDLIVRAGVTAGTLFVGSVGGPHRRVYTARGDEMNLAAHLLQRAAPGEILVSGRVREEIGERYSVSAPEDMLIKGHALPMPVARVSAEVAHLRPAVAQPSAPLIGRESERRAVREAMHAAIDGEARLVLLAGEAGIGKSMLLYDLMAHWVERGLRGYRAACSSGGQAIALQAWRALTLALHGPVDSEPPAGSASDLLRDWLAGSGEAEPQSLIEPLAVLVERQLAFGPLLICLEDVHWADELSLLLVERLFAAHQVARAAEVAPQPWPLLIALSFRPFDSPTLHRLHRLPAVVAVRLERLNDRESEEMIRLLLGASAVERHLAYDIYTYTDGQPLFIKESLLALRQRHLIGVDEGLASRVRDTVDLQASDSALDIVQATVDQLDEETRLTLKVAAVIGRTFPLRLLIAIHPAQPAEQQLRDHLRLLTRLALVDLELDEPEQVYRFRYQITHDVAYTSLLFAQRRNLHAAVARWYEGAFRDDIAADRAPLAVYDVLIEHLRLSEEMSERARYCRAAAEKAARQYAPTTALAYIESALPLTTEPLVRYDLIMLRVAINERWGNQFTQAEDLATLQSLSEMLGDQQRQAYVAFYQARYLLAMGLYQTALAAALRAGSIAKRARAVASNVDEQQRAIVLRAGSIDACGLALSALGQIERAATLHRRALIMYRVDRRRLAGADGGTLYAPLPILFDLPIALVQCLNNLGTLSFNRGDLGQAEELYQRATVTARAGGDWIGEARARERLGRLALARHDYDAALTDANSALTTGQASGDRLGQALALQQISAIWRGKGDLIEAQRFAIHAHAMSASIGSRALEAYILHEIAEIADALGLDDEAASARHEAERAQGTWWRKELPTQLSSVAVG